MDASLSHATGINKPLRFFKRFVAVEAIKLDRNQIKRLVLACRFDLTAIDFGNYRSPRSISGLEGADGEPLRRRWSVIFILAIMNIRPDPDFAGPPNIGSGDKMTTALCGKFSPLTNLPMDMNQMI